MWKHKTGIYYYGKRTLGTRDKRKALKREKVLRRGLWAVKNGLVPGSPEKLISKTFKEVSYKYLTIKKQTRKR